VVKDDVLFAVQITLPTKVHSPTASQSCPGFALEGIYAQRTDHEVLMLLCYLYPVIVFYVDRNVDAPVEVCVSSAVED